MNLDQIGPLLERASHRRSVLGVSLEHPPQVVLVGGQVGRGGGRRGLGEQGDEPGDDARGPQCHQKARQLAVEIEGARGEDGGDLLGNAGLHFGWGGAQPNDRQFAGAGEIEPARVIERSRVDAIQRGKHRRLRVRIGLPGDGDRGGDPAEGIAGRQGTILPELDRLVLERHAGRGPDESVGMPEVW